MLFYSMSIFLLTEEKWKKKEEKEEKEEEDEEDDVELKKTPKTANFYILKVNLKSR